MNSKSTNFIIFVLGFSIGSLITWQCVKKKYRQIAQDEIDSVKYAFLRGERSKVNPIDNDLCDTEELFEVQEISNRSGYTVYSDAKNLNRKEDKDLEKPYVITPEEFGEFTDYEEISLTYYSDGMLADDCDELVDDVEEIIGLDSLNHFGEYETDSVFVRNDALKCDYEILLDHRKYSDVIKIKPNQM